MKKNILSILLILSSLSISGQIEKGNFIFSLNGNYLKTYSSDGVTTNNMTIHGKYLNLGTSVGYFFGDHLDGGIGFDYFWAKESKNSYTAISYYRQEEVLHVKSKLFLPNIFLGYYQKIYNHLYVSTQLKLNYGKSNSEYSTYYVCIETVPDTATIIGPSYGFRQEESEGKSDSKYFMIQFIPSLSYFINSKMGLYIEIGGINYNLIDWETDNSSFSFNFNPNHWRFGISLRL